MIRTRMRLRLARLVILCAIAAPGCTTPTVKPVVAKDPEIACPGGVTAWRLALSDQRADRRDSEKVLRAIRESIARSLPGCQWLEKDAPEISIEVDRFQVRNNEDTWEAFAEFDVIARDRGGRTLTQFRAESSIARPNYRGMDNEKMALQEALDKAMQRALAGLRAVPNPG